MSATSELIVRISGDATKYQQALDDVKKETKDLEDQLGKVAKVSGAAFAVGAASIGLATKAAGDFQNKFTNVVTLLDDSSFKTKSLNQGIADLKKGVIQLGKETGQPFETLNAGLFDLVSSGVPAEKAIETLRTATELAAAGATDTATAVKALSATMTAFGDKAGDAQAIAEKFFTAQKFGVTTVGDLAKEFNKVAGLANNLGISFDEALASLSSLTADGAKPTAEAATQLKAAMAGVINIQQNLAKESDAVQQALSLQNIKQKGLVTAMMELKAATGGSIPEMKRLLGSSEALAAVLSLTGAQSELVQKQMNAMSDAQARAATFADALKTKKETVNAAVARFNRTIEAGAIVIGEKFAPLIAKAADLLSGLFGILSDSPILAKTAALFLGIGTALAGIVTAGALAATAFLKIRAAMIALNISTKALGISVKTLVGATGIGLLIIVASEVVARWDTIWPKARDTFIDFANEVIPVAENIANFFIEAFNSIVNGVVKFARSYVAVWKNLLRTIMNVGESLGDILIGIFTLDDDKIDAGVEKAKAALVDGVKGAIDDIKKIANEDSEPVLVPIKLDRIDKPEAQAQIDEDTKDLTAKVDTTATPGATPTGTGVDPQAGVDAYKAGEKAKTEALTEEQKRRIQQNKNAMQIIEAENRRASDREIEFIRRKNDLAIAEEKARGEKNAQVRASELALVQAQKEQLDEEERKFLEARKQRQEQDAERRLAFNEEFDQLEKEQRAEFLEEDRELYEERVLTRDEAEREVAARRLQENIDRRNQYLKDEAEFGKAVAKVNKVLASEQVALAKQSANELVQLSQSKNATLKDIGKAAAVAQIAIDTAQGAASIFAKLNALVPFAAPAIGAAGAASIIAFGAEKTANVLAANTGGLVPRNLGIPGQDSVNALLTPGELVVPERNFEEVVGAVAANRGGGTTATENVEDEDQGIDIRIAIEPQGDLMDMIEQQIIERRVQGVGKL